MPIQPTDIKLLESERMRDTSDGGGRMTGRVIPSGEAGNVFPKVSRVDSVYGRVNLRKIYVAVRTATLDMYAGAHAIITDPPDNARISCVLFSTGSNFDQRSSARDRIESYLVSGALSRMRLYGTQLVGQKAISCYQRVEEPLPDVGEVFVLSVEPGSAQQYVRVTDVSHEVRTFTDSSGDFKRRVLTLKIGSRLTTTFAGAEPSRFANDPGATKIRMSQVADASRYYGLQPLSEDALSGAMTLRLPSIYANLVPSTQRETPVSMAEVAGARSVRGTATSPITFTASSTQPVSGSTAYRWVLPRLPVPGSLAGSIGGIGGLSFSDNGAGSILITGGTGTINYETGEVTITRGGLGDGAVAATYTPAVSASHAAHTRRVEITLGTRGTVYAETLGPVPAPGTLIVDYRALGRWYRLRDDGTGQLVGASPAEGTGSVSYVTGAAVITLGALPDVGSALLMAWGSPVHYAVRAGAATDAATTARLEYLLEHAPIVPGTVSISYPVGGVMRSATDSTGNGTLSGTGVSGTINYATGAVTLSFSSLPDRAANVSNGYVWREGADLYSGTSAVISGGQFTVPGAGPWRAGGTMTFTINDVGGAMTVLGYITAGGSVRIRPFRDGPAWAGWARQIDDQAVGVFDVTSGVVTLTSAVHVKSSVWVSTSGGGEWVASPRSAPITGVSDIVVERDTAAYDPQSITGEVIGVAALGLSLDLTQTVADRVVPGSVLIRLTGKTYVDRSGTLYTDLDAITGAGTPAGSIDYETGVVTVNFWADNVAFNRAVDACLTQYGDWTATQVTFRTAGSPIRPASLYVQVNGMDGQLLTGTADLNGVISGPLMRGGVEQSMGVVYVEFGELVAGEWVPLEVMPDTLRYNCVVLTDLPLDPDLLGLDPVRLPADGRVPIFRQADIVVVHNTQRTELPNPVVAGQTYSVGRSGLATLTLVDGSNHELTSGYIVSLEAGTLTMAADWTGSGVAQPLTAVHRIEHMDLVSDVQINGDVTLASGLPRAFPAAGTYVSSALPFGDMQAVVSNVFDQQTWGGVWADTITGGQAAAQYDDINYPIEVLNESAVTERWRINFTSSTAFQVIGENVGVIATGSVSTDLSPLNPVTGEAYFILRAAGWGGGWSAGNQLRFNTVGANRPLWIARTILAGASLAGDSFDIEARGDVD